MSYELRQTWLDELPPDVGHFEQRSVGAWQISYGRMHEETGHTVLAYLGFCPYSAATNTYLVWLSPQVEKASSAVLRLCRKFFSSFTQEHNLRLVAMVEENSAVTGRFAEFFGFVRSQTTYAGHTLYWRR